MANGCRTAEGISPNGRRCNLGSRFESRKPALPLDELTNAVNVERLGNDDVEILAVLGMGESSLGRSAVMATNLGTCRCTPLQP